MGAHARAGSRMRLERLTTLTLLALMVSLTVMRLLLEIEHDFVYYLFYGVVAVAGISLALRRSRRCSRSPTS